MKKAFFFFLITHKEPSVQSYNQYCIHNKLTIKVTKTHHIQVSLIKATQKKEYVATKVIKYSVGANMGSKPLQPKILRKELFLSKHVLKNNKHIRQTCNCIESPGFTFHTKAFLRQLLPFTLVIGKLSHFHMTYFLINLCLQSNGKVRVSTSATNDAVNHHPQNVCGNWGNHSRISNLICFKFSIL